MMTRHRVFLMVVAASAAIATALLFVSTWNEPHWFDASRVGGAGEWFAGIVTAGTLAFLAADHVKISQDRELAVEEARLRQRRQQAESVTAWPIAWNVADRPNDRGYRPADVVVRINNASESAVYHAMAHISFHRGQGYVGASASAVILPPGEHVDQTFSSAVDEADTPLLPPLVMIWFTDAAGQHWWRYDGELHETKDHMRPDQMGGGSRSWTRADGTRGAR